MGSCEKTLEHQFFRRLNLFMNNSLGSLLLQVIQFSELHYLELTQPLWVLGLYKVGKRRGGESFGIFAVTLHDFYEKLKVLVPFKKTALA